MVAVATLLPWSFAALALPSAREVVRGYEKRALLVRGEISRMCEPGLCVVPPFVSETHATDRRAMQLEPSPGDESTTSGDGTVDADFVAEYRIDDPEAALHRLESQPHATFRKRVVDALEDAVPWHPGATPDDEELREVTEELRKVAERAFGDPRPDGVGLER